MKWREAIEQGSRELETSGIRDARLNAELLAAFILGGWKRGDVREHLEKEIGQDQSMRFSDVVARRFHHEPLQHITGETEFFGLRLFSSAAALVPRPDTEILVDESLKELSEMAPAIDRPHILDIGTGSGAIPLAIASKMPTADCIGIDTSTEALALAEKNRSRLGLANVRFHEHDLFGDLSSLGTFDIIVSNPPYINEEEYQRLEKEVKDFEPRAALLAHDGGFAFYKRIAEAALPLLHDHGVALLETGFDMSDEVGRIFIQRGWRILRSVSDLSGIQRVVVIKKIILKDV
jgi:release factor glutamine methyltransferase